MTYWRSWNPIELPTEEVSSRHSWGGVQAPYAIAVFFGLEKGHVARPWTEYAIENSDHERMLRDSVVLLDPVDTFVNYSYSLGFEFQEAIESDIWDWPNRTLRVSGEIVDSPRNIVDTGRLRDSQDIEFFGI